MKISKKCICKCSDIGEVCGDIDALVSYIGVTKAQALPYFIDQLEIIQRLLFLIGSECTNFNYNGPKISSELVAELKANIENIEQIIKMPTTFILPGKNLFSANTDMCRVLCRKLERSLHGLTEKNLLKNEFILIWINDLSKFLFLLARESENNSYNIVK